MTAIKSFFSKIGALFLIFEKDQGRDLPPAPSSYVPDCWFIRQVGLKNSQKHEI